MIFIQCSHDSSIIRHDFSITSSLDLVKEGHTLGKSQLGKPGLESPAGNREASRSIPEQNALDNQGGGGGDKGHGQRREGEERTLMLAEVHYHCANAVALKQQRAIVDW